MYGPLALLLLQLPRLSNTCFVLLRIPTWQTSKSPAAAGILGINGNAEIPKFFQSSNFKLLPFMRRFIKVITIVMKPLLF